MLRTPLDGRRRAPRRRAALAAVVAVVVVAAACSGGGGTKKAAKPTAATRAASTTSTTAPRPAVAPLTGLPDPGRVAEGRPVLDVKVENTPPARPQKGLEQADIVWEEVVEGGITRFLAMFESNLPPVVGPVRSVRLTDPLIVWPVGGVFAFSGGAQYALNGIQQAPVTLVDEGRAGPAMFRDSSRKAPHNLYGRPADLIAKGGGPIPPPSLFTYLPAGTPFPGTPAASVTIGFSSGFGVTWTWNAASGTWKRSMGAAPFVMADGTQIDATNVVVMAVPYAGGVGVEGAEASLVGSGHVWVLSAGGVAQGTWTRADKTQPAVLTDPSGAPIRLTPGRTWVELPDVTYAVTVAP